MDDNLETIIAIDFDGTILDDIAIARLLMDYATKNKKLGMIFTYPIIKLYSIVVKAFGKITSGNEEFDLRRGYKTGETTSLSLVNKLVFQKYQIPLSFLECESKKLAAKIPKKYVDAINNSKIPVIIATSEPKELVKKICDYAGINVYDILGNSFIIENDKIYGIDELELEAGPRGKYKRLKEFKREHPEIKEIISIGDTVSDMVGTEYYTLSNGLRRVADKYIHKGDLSEVIESISQERTQH